MVHYPILMIIPQDIYNQGAVAITDYIRNTTEPYRQQEVPPYIEIPHEELMNEFLVRGRAYGNIEDYADAMGYELDLQGNVINYVNPNTLFDYYTIGGGWNLFLTTGERGWPDINSLDGNIVPVSDVLLLYNRPVPPLGPTFLFRPDVVIDENGQAYGDQGEPVGDWLFYEIMARNGNSYAVLLDAHI